MAVLRCKMCGGDLEVKEGISSCTCEFCGTEQTIPTVKDENLQGLFNRANVLRMKSEFDKAGEIYEKILQNRESEAEAYWGLILCKYGIEYVEDPKTFKRIPTCHRTSYDAITADEDYKNALKYADVVQRGIYETEANAIDEVQKGILAISQKEEPYDVFICYKETDDTGKRTVDSTIANDIYYQLTQEGFKVFYAAITLEDKLGTEYEPYIFSALNTAKVMLALGTKPEYFNAVWVKNEWSRFLKIMKQDRAKMLIPCYRDMDAYELPEEFAHLQAQDMTKIGFINDIVRGIKKIIAKDDSGNETKESPNIQQSSNNASVNALLDRGNMALEDQEWDKANEYFDQALNYNARCGEAYLGKMLAENEFSSVDGFMDDLKKRYSNAKLSSCTACNADQSTINDTVSKYTLPGYLEADTIKDLFIFKLEYIVMDYHDREAKLKEFQTYLESDKLLKRVSQFLSGEKKESFADAIEKVESELRQALEQSKVDDDNKKNDIIKNYTAHVKAAVEKAEHLYDEALSQKEKDLEKNYQKLVALQESASEEWEYHEAMSGYEEIGDYKDAEERAAECRKNILKIETKQRKRDSIFKVVIGAVIIAAIVIAFVRGSKYLHEEYYIYKEAVSLYEKREFGEAAAKFVLVGDYEDSKQYISEIYERAVSLYKDEKYNTSFDIFKSLGDYKDSKQYFDDICEKMYEQAVSLYKDKKYQVAADVFRELGEYKDSSEYYNEIHNILHH